MSLVAAACFRLGLAVQLVSGPGQPFHARILVFSYFALATHQRAAESVGRLFLDSLPCGKSVGPRLYSERTFVDVILVCGENVEDMPELVEQDKNLSVHRITAYGPTSVTRGPRLVKDRLPSKLQLRWPLGRKRPFCVDGNCRVRPSP